MCLRECVCVGAPACARVRRRYLRQGMKTLPAALKNRAAAAEAFSRSDLWGADDNVCERACTCLHMCTQGIDRGSPSPPDLPVPTPSMASCLGECRSTVPTSPCSSLCLPAKPRPDPPSISSVHLCSCSTMQANHLCRTD